LEGLDRGAAAVGDVEDVGGGVDGDLGEPLAAEEGEAADVVGAGAGAGGEVDRVAVFVELADDPGEEVGDVDLVALGVDRDGTGAQVAETRRCGPEVGAGAFGPEGGFVFVGGGGEGRGGGEAGRQGRDVEESKEREARADEARASATHDRRFDVRVRSCGRCLGVASHESLSPCPSSPTARPLPWRPPKADSLCGPCTACSLNRRTVENSS
jgi:hypothetical protein